MPDIIVTGIPRSGTTLASALIDSLPDTVCLNEPLWQVSGVAPAPEDFAKWLVGDFWQLRQKLRRGEPVPDRRSPDGAAVTNYYKAGARMESSFTMVPFTRGGLSPDFNLAVKHNGPYLGVLRHLIGLDRFTIIAVVRHPLAVIASWRSLDLPVSHGRMPTAAAYWPEMAELCDAPIDLLEKQVKMYDLMCRRIHNQRRHIHVITYEALVEDPATLCAALGITHRLSAQLIRRPLEQQPEAEAALITRALKMHGRFYREFYPDL